MISEDFMKSSYIIELIISNLTRVPEIPSVARLAAGGDAWKRSPGLSFFYW